MIEKAALSLVVVERSVCEVVLGVDWTDDDELIGELDDSNDDGDEDDEIEEEILLLPLEDDDNELLKLLTEL